MSALVEMDTVAARLGISRQRAYDLARRRLIPAVKIGRNWKMDQGRLEQWIADGGAALPGGWRNEVEE